MEFINDGSVLFEGRAECESAMKQPGSGCVFEHQELQDIGRKLSAFLEDFNADGIDSSAAARWPHI
jgi:hypothetical protein